MIASDTKVAFPSQKKSYKEKNEQWRKECIDGAESICILRSESLRKNAENKRINYDLYSNILDQNDIERTCNPHKIIGLNAPAKMQNYPIVIPKIDLLVGESITRPFDFKVSVVNQDAISEKENFLRDSLRQLIITHLQSKDITEDQMKEELTSFQDYMDFEYQDAREKVATQVLSYLYKHLKLDQLFSWGFKDALLVAEEIYLTDIIAGEPVIKRINPNNLYVVRSGESPWIEDSDIITIIDYLSPGQIIDEYHSELTPGDIDYIESGLNNKLSSNKKGIDIGAFYDRPLDPKNALDIDYLAGDLFYGNKFDAEGNIRRTRVFWKSMRKLKKVTYYDESGEEQCELYDENYKIDKTKGEKEEILWVSEWWEGHKLGSTLTSNNDRAIYTRMRPKPVQFRSMENPSKCHPGITGKIYNTNDNQGVSLMDRMKPYQYLYNILNYNVELAISKNYGKIMRLGLHEVPDGWDIDKWLSFAQGMNIAVYDAFKEGNKGAAQGKMAGAMNQNSPVIDMEMGNTIQLYINMMEHIKREVGEISGVSQARQGQIQNRQAVGNTETEIQQTSMITEYWFQEHEVVKIKALECLLETAKYAWKDKKNKKIQYILDDGGIMMLNLDTEQFSECEYGLLITNSNKNKKFERVLEQAAMAGIQNQTLKFSSLLDIYQTESLSAARRKIVRAEKEKEKRDAMQLQQQQEMQNQKIAAAQQASQEEKSFRREEWDREDARNEAVLLNKLEIERMRQDNDESRSSENINDTDYHSIEQLREQQRKNAKEYDIKKEQLAEQKRHNKEEERLKEKSINKKPTTNK